MGPEMASRSTAIPVWHKLHDLNLSFLLAVNQTDIGSMLLSIKWRPFAGPGQ
jgi:hypothetical protein